MRGNSYNSIMHEQEQSLLDRITVEPGKRSGRPCIRRLRIAVHDVLDALAAGMSHQEIIEDYPELELEDIRAVLLFASLREHRLAGRTA